MIDLVAALSAVVVALEESETEYILVGSTAAATWGVVRTTQDVDLVALLSPAQIEKLLARLTDDEFYVPVEEARRSTSGGSFNVLHPASGGKVDVFVPTPGDAFTASRMRRRIRANVFDIPTWVATPEDVVVAKLAWRRESRSEVQWRDCVEIVASNDLDREYMTYWASELDVVDDLEDLFAIPSN